MSKVQQLFSGTKKRNKVLEQIPIRTLVFVHGIADNENIAEIMKPAGYVLETQNEAFRLLEQAAGYGLTVTGGTSGPDHPSSDAIGAVSDWFGPSFDRIQAALAHLHPAQEEYVFSGLVRVSGMASVVAASVLLDRLADLAGKGPGAAARKASVDEDKKAMATLALRGFDDAELARAHALVDAAHSAMASGSPVVADVDEQEKRLLALKAWFDDWSETARALVTRRGDLIKIGLAHPRAAAPAPDPAGGPGIAPPTPGAVPPVAPVAPAGVAHT